MRKPPTTTTATTATTKISIQWFYCHVLIYYLVEVGRFGRAFYENLAINSNLLAPFDFFSPTGLSKVLTIQINSFKTIRRLIRKLNGRNQVPFNAGLILTYQFRTALIADAVDERSWWADAPNNSIDEWQTVLLLCVTISRVECRWTWTWRRGVFSPKPPWALTEISSLNGESRFHYTTNRLCI